MNPWIGWALAALFVAIAWQQYGWQGVLFAFSVVVFWLLLQLSRTLRVMRAAGQRPVGTVDSAVMLNARLKPGLTMLQVIALARSLGRKLGEGEDDWVWADEGGSRVTLHFENGKLARFELDRPAP